MKEFKEISNEYIDYARKIEEIVVMLRLMDENNMSLGSSDVFRLRCKMKDIKKAQDEIYTEMDKKLWNFVFDPEDDYE